LSSFKSLRDIYISVHGLKSGGSTFDQYLQHFKLCWLFLFHVPCLLAIKLHYVRAIIMIAIGIAVVVSIVSSNLRIFFNYLDAGFGA